MKLSYENIKAGVGIPIWTFSGLGIIALIIIAVIISDKQKAAKVTGLIPAMKQGDILHIKMTDGAYTLAKVNKVKGDSVFVQFNNYQTDRETDFESLKAKGYGGKEEILTVADLKEMNKEELLLDIER